MEIIQNEQERYEEARKKVNEIKGFYANLGSYVICNSFFLVLNLLTTPHDLWFYWPMLGWGIGVLFHAMKVFNFTPFLGKNWEDRKIKKLMEKEKNNPNWK